jgi:hypothetical protein
MDQFKDFPVTLTSPATNAASITPSDTTPLSTVSRALYVGVAGDLSVEMQSGEIVVFQGVQSGSILALRALKVRQTATTAAGIVALW